MRARGSDEQRSGVIGALAFLLGATASAQTVTEQADVSGGRVKVSITPVQPGTALNGPKRAPRVGVTSTGDLSAPIARMLDATGTVRVTSPARFTAGAQSFDAMTKAEFADELATACRQSKVDYILFGGATQMNWG